MTRSDGQELDSILFPKGTQFNENQIRSLLEQYKLLLETSEKLVARRQTLNTFFLSVNVLLLSAIGTISKEVTTEHIIAIGIIAISLAGVLLCESWRRLVRSYSQLNAGKFVVLHLIEQHLPAALFKAEWEALGGGRDKKKYNPTTSVESWIPRIFSLIYILASIVALIRVW